MTAEFLHNSVRYDDVNIFYPNKKTGATLVHRNLKSLYCETFQQHICYEMSW